MSHDQLLELIGCMCDGTATAAQRDALDRLLADDPEARFLYIEHLDLHARLQWRQRGRAQTIIEQPTPTLRSSRSVWSSALAAAAVIALAMTAWFVFTPDASTQSAAPGRQVSHVAMISEISSDAVFADAPEPMRQALELTSGVVKMTAGRMQLMYHSGAVVDLTAPCEFEITGTNQGFLHRGSLDALVPARAAGFTVHTPGGVRVVDLGTRFTLVVGDDQASLLRVITGLVQVTTDQVSSQQVAAGQAVAVRSGQVTAVAFHDPRDTLAYLRFEQLDQNAVDARLLTNDAEGHPPAHLRGGEIVSDCFDPIVPLTGLDNRASLALNRNGGRVEHVELVDTLGAALGDDGVTIEAWVRLDEPGTSKRQPLVQCKRIGDSDQQMAFQLMAQAGATQRSPRPDVMAFCVGDGETAYFIFSKLGITDTDWHHISAAYDPQAGTLRFTLDDQVEHVAAPRIRPHVSRGPVVIGAHSSITGKFDAVLNGGVDELRISRGVLPMDALLTAPNRSAPHQTTSLSNHDESEGDTP
ncbi:LamG domain-containing protein [Planctomycetales bacterium ZRK34]|nr:LamG domain-containing protein [Planctomycetales bacterium ZRK34]